MKYFTLDFYSILTYVVIMAAKRLNFISINIISAFAMEKFLAKGAT